MLNAITVPVQTGGLREEAKFAFYPKTKMTTKKAVETLKPVGCFESLVITAVCVLS